MAALKPATLYYVHQGSYLEDFLKVSEARMDRICSPELRESWEGKMWCQLEVVDLDNLRIITVSLVEL